MRGVPANYGGLETVAEEVGARLAQRGHSVRVYCRPHGTSGAMQSYRQMRRIELPSVRRKHLDTPTHTAAASVHALLHRSDVVHVFGVGNAPWLPLLRLAGRGTVISVDGMDWRRRKWGPVARTLLERSALLAIRAAGACITDSREVARYYRERYGREPEYIGHGADTRPVTTDAALRRYELAPREYFLFVGRLTPEKGVHHLIDAFAGVESEKPLVIIGDGSADQPYWRALRTRAASDGRVRLLGPIYGDAVRELLANAYAYVQPSEVEGTALSLVEAMGYGNCVLVSNIPENLETVGDAGLSFDISNPVESLRAGLRRLVASPDVVVEHREKSSARARQHFSWEPVTDAHERLYYRVARVPAPMGLLSDALEV